jgi:hypothetical protein
MHAWKQKPFESIQMKILNKQPLVYINDKVKRMSGGKYAKENRLTEIYREV